MSALDRVIALRAALHAIPDPVRVRCSWRTFTDLHVTTNDAIVEAEAKQMASVLAFKRDDGAFIPFEAHLELEDGILTVDTLSGAVVTLAWPYVDIRYQTEGLPIVGGLDMPTVIVNPQALAKQVAQGNMDYLRWMVNQAEADEAEDYDPGDD